MHKSNISNDMKLKNLTMIKGEGHGSREGGGAFMSNTNYQRIEI
jgi:hypothetical protein